MEVTHNTNPSLLERQTPIRQNIGLTDLWLQLQLSWVSVHTHQSGSPQTTSNVTQEQTQLGTSVQPCGTIPKLPHSIFVMKLPTSPQVCCKVIHFIGYCT